MSDWLKRNSVDFDPDETLARRKFCLHDHVRPSGKAVAQGLARDRQGNIYRGAIVGFHQDGVRVKVHRIGFKDDQYFHMDFWERIEGERVKGKSAKSIGSRAYAKKRSR